MKIYFVDKYKKNLNIKKKLEELGIENIEYKENINYRIYKTDVVISFDFENDYEEYKKVNNLILITDKKEKNDIWNMANMLNTRDIILNQDNNEYIANRIKNVIEN